MFFFLFLWIGLKVVVAAAAHNRKPTRLVRLSGGSRCCSNLKAACYDSPIRTPTRRDSNSSRQEFALGIIVMA